MPDTNVAVKPGLRSALRSPVTHKVFPGLPGETHTQLYIRLEDEKGTAEIQRLFPLALEDVTMDDRANGYWDIDGYVRPDGEYMTRDDVHHLIGVSDSDALRELGIAEAVLSSDRFRRFRSGLRRSGAMILPLVEMGYKVDRKPRADALSFADEVKGILGQLGIAANDVHYGGSLRRNKPTVGDIDVVVVGAEINKDFYLRVIQALQQRGHTVQPKVVGDSHASMLVDSFLLELKKTAPASLGAALLFTTGSGEFNMGMRAYAKAKGMMLQQYGLFKRNPDNTAGERLAAATEEEIFKALGVDYIEPAARDRFPMDKFPFPRKEAAVPFDWSKVPPEIAAKAKAFVLPAQDEKGRRVPDDMMWSAQSRHNYYRMGGSFRLPDAMKLDRYLKAPQEELPLESRRLMEYLWR